MAKYIDIDKALLEFYKAHEDDEFTPNIIALQTFLLYYPPVDVRPVVYCKDCDEAKRNTVDGAIYCSVWDYWEMPEKGFCHYGSSIMKDGD